MDVISEMKSDMHLKDDEIFLLYDVVKEELCPFYGKFFGNRFFLMYLDDTKETGTPASYDALRKLMEAVYVPVNSYILILGRKRSNYYMNAIEQFMNSHDYKFNEPFVMEIPAVVKGTDGSDARTVEKATCIVRRYGTLERDGKEDLPFVFEHIINK